MSDYLTARFPGTGGSVKQEPEDFRVEEIPRYLPCGEGEHLYLEVEKRGMTTFDALSRLARALGVSERAMGFAGLKDARAETRQWISVAGVEPDQVGGVEIEGLRILSARRHRNKLRLGHLAGNRFRIRVRSVTPGALEHARDSLHVLQGVGVPNFFGEQRYGVLGNSHRIGRALVRRDFEGAAAEIVGDPAGIANESWRLAAEAFAGGDLARALELLPGRFRNERRLIHQLRSGQSAEAAVLGLPRKLLRLYLSAYQSSLFDRLVRMRLATLEMLWAGDLAYLHDRGACFLVEDPDREQPRADRLEISPTGLLAGYKVRLAGGQAGILEESLLESEEVSRQDFRLPQGLAMEGERRPLRVPLLEGRAELEGEDLLLGFTLPPGSYATSVLREILKNEAREDASS